MTSRLVRQVGDGIDAFDDTSMESDTQSKYVMRMVFSLG